MTGYFCECKKEHRGFYNWYSSLECKEHILCSFFVKDKLCAMRLKINNGYIFYSEFDKEIIIEHFNIDHTSLSYRTIVDKHYEFTTIENLSNYLIKISENLIFY